LEKVLSHSVFLQRGVNLSLTILLLLVSTIIKLLKDRLNTVQKLQSSIMNQDEIISHLIRKESMWRPMTMARNSARVSNHLVFPQRVVDLSQTVLLLLVNMIIKLLRVRLSIVPRLQSSIMSQDEITSCQAKSRQTLIPIIKVNHLVQMFRLLHLRRLKMSREYQHVLVQVPMILRGLKL